MSNTGILPRIGFDVVSVDDSLLEMILQKGVDPDDISLVKLKFVNEHFATVTITIADQDDVILGSGSATIAGRSVDVNLSDIVTVAERPNVRLVNVDIA